MPPVRTGVAVYSADAVAALSLEYAIDVFTDQPAPGARSAHDFLWEHQQRPYDLTVYQLGNSSFHDYIWPYLFRHPGLTVLHDAHLHHARAAQLLRVKRAADYRAEFVANHPEAPGDMAELAIAGFDNYLYYRHPMRKLVVDASRATAVHALPLVEELVAECPDAVVEHIRMTHGEAVGAREEREQVRRSLGVSDDQVVFGVFGALTPEKRVPQVLDAFADIRRYATGARLLLAGAAATHYDVAADVARLGLDAVVIRTGYLPDEALTGHLLACDVSINLRWPTAREMSGPWLRALAVGLPTIVVDLEHTADVPSLDPRSWTVAHSRPTGHRPPSPVTVGIDILDEAHSLRLAMRRLATDAALRAELGAAAAAHWHRDHSLERMVGDYRRAIARAMERPATTAAAANWPAHLTDRGDRLLNELLGSMGVRA
jgi:glycosyltransferase involved in cell wall biosynthesis